MWPDSNAYFYCFPSYVEGYWNAELCKCLLISRLNTIYTSIPTEIRILETSHSTLNLCVTIFFYHSKSCICSWTWNNSNNNNNNTSMKTKRKQIKRRIIINLKNHQMNFEPILFVFRPNVSCVYTVHYHGSKRHHYK